MAGNLSLTEHKPPKFSAKVSQSDDPLNGRTEELSRLDILRIFQYIFVFGVRLAESGELMDAIYRYI